MRKIVGVMAMLLFAASCVGGSNRTAPHNMDNACSVLEQRPGFIRAFRASERRWGVPVHVQMATLYQESKFISNARTPRRYRLGFIPAGRVSSAYGYAQAIDGTWDEYRRKRGRPFARRDDIADAADFMGWYMRGSHERLGIALDDARNQYLAYHEGRAGYARGAHLRKPWLMRVADEVAARAETYRRQLARCPAARR